MLLISVVRDSERESSLRWKVICLTGTHSLHLTLTLLESNCKQRERERKEKRRERERE